MNGVVELLRSLCLSWVRRSVTDAHISKIFSGCCQSLHSRLNVMNRGSSYCVCSSSVSYAEKNNHETIFTVKQ